METSGISLSSEELAMLRADADGTSGDLKRQLTVVKHDLAAEDESIGFNDAALDMINERFSRHLRAGLVDVLRTTPRIQIEKSRTTRYAQFLQGLRAPLSVNTIKIDPLRGYSLVIIDPSVIFSSLDNFFGGFGKGIGDLPPTRLFTPTETSIIKILLNLVFGALKEAWSPVLGLDFSHAASEINPQFAQIADENDLVIVSTFELNLGPNVDGKITIVHPFISMKPIRDLLRSRIQTSEENDEKTRLWQVDMHDACLDAKLTVQVKLAEIPSTLEQVRAFKPGDVVFFNKPDHAWAEVSGFALFDVEIGTLGTNAAARLESFRVLKPQENTSNE
jgi:flagellar motor switch protein FliM